MMRGDGNPAWPGPLDKMKKIPLSLPLFLLFIVPVLFVSVTQSIHYGIALTLCTILSHKTGRIEPQHKSAPRYYVASFALQVACVVYGLISLCYD